jgi:hypothetical protein
MKNKVIGLAAIVIVWSFELPERNHRLRLMLLMLLSRLLKLLKLQFMYLLNLQLYRIH